MINNIDFDYLDKLSEYRYCQECEEYTHFVASVYLYGFEGDEEEEGYGITCKSCYLKNHK